MKDYTISEAYESLKPLYDMRKVREALGKSKNKQAAKDLDTAFICIEAVKEVYKITFEEMQSPKYCHKATAARYAAAWMMRKKTKLYHREITKLFNRPGFAMSAAAKIHFGESCDPNIREEQRRLLIKYNEISRARFIQAEYDEQIPF